MGWGPTKIERQGLHFLIGSGALGARYLIAAVLFIAGAGVCSLVRLDPSQMLIGVGLLLAGHVPLWVLGQTLAPGGATPSHEDLWVPAEEGWFEQLQELEKRGRRWDVSPWDITSWAGFLTLAAASLMAAVACGAVFEVIREENAVRLAIILAALGLPLWLNGMRTKWNPGELRLKGRALDWARRRALGRYGERYDAVPLLALLEGDSGKFPVDARLMLRPKEDDGSGLIGVQVQVCLNNVKGKDYPYLYCVVLAKPGFRFREAKTPLTTERGSEGEVIFLVVRQHADRRGGWHTGERAIDGIVDTALRIAERGRPDHH